MYGRRHGVPLIWHVAHDTDVSPANIDSGRNFVRRWLEKRALEFGLRRADAVVVQSERQAQLLRSHYRREATLIVRNFHPRPMENIAKESPPTVLWVANLKPAKRPELFANLAWTLRDVDSVRFVMIGAPPTDARSRKWVEPLMRKVRSANIEFLGSLGQNEVNSWIARADLLISTSAHEGFPNTFIQAWMRDAVVVSLGVDPDGILEREAIGAYATSEEELAAVVRRLIGDRGQRALYCERARKYAHERYSLRNVEPLAELVELHASRGGPRRPFALEGAGKAQG